MDTRGLFPFVLFGDRPAQTVGDTMPEVKADEPEAVTSDTAFRDFRPINIIKGRVAPAPGPKVEAEEADPKASSATDAAPSSPSESPVSLVDLEALRAAVERESRQSDPDPAVDEAEEVTTGNNEPPAQESIPTELASLISSSQLL
jgi:hypothetical protein